MGRARKEPLGTDEDLDRAALTIAYAIANPCMSPYYDMVKILMFLI